MHAFFFILKAYSLKKRYISESIVPNELKFQPFVIAFTNVSNVEVDVDVECEQESDCEYECEC